MTIPAGATKFNIGVRKGRSASGLIRRISHTDAQTTTKANSVPMLTMWPRASKGKSEAVKRDHDSREDRRLVRRAEARMHRAEEALRQQPVAGHGQQHARLAQEHHQQHAGDPVRAPIEMTTGAVLLCITSSNTPAIGALSGICGYGTIPVTTAATAM